MVYELWEVTSGNMLADFETENDALELVRRMITEQGASALDTFELLVEYEPEEEDEPLGAFAAADEADGSGLVARSAIIAEGKGLVELALATSPQRSK